MPNFRYRALTAKGVAVAGVLEAADAEGVVERILGLGLIPIDDAPSEADAPLKTRVQRPRGEDVTAFARDLALLLRTGTPIDGALQLLSEDRELGRMHPLAAELHQAVISGQSFAEALETAPYVFPPIFVALTRTAEQTATLPTVLESIASERVRAEGLRRRLIDALRYPAFLFVAACAVLIFFLTFVLPQFSDVFNDFHAKPDPVLASFLALSASLRENGTAYAAGMAVLATLSGLILSNKAARMYLIGQAARLPIVGTAVGYHRTILFCRNLGLLLSGGMSLSAALRILADVMSATGATRWSAVVDFVRRGGKLSDALAAETLLPTMAVRTLRLGEDSNQLQALAARSADYYEARLDRIIDRIVGFVGPLAIIVISTIVGGLIVSIMTALLSVNQMVD